ncbi:MAG: heterodisulfide reductase-related iron-sulfur binding cluster [Bryobacteraceae bacterium]
MKPEGGHREGPAQFDLDRCVRCGLCLNACPTYRELGLEMDSPRGRVYSMVQVADSAAAPGPSYIEHLDLCLGCRACETACPSGVQYGRLIEAARAGLETVRPRSLAARLARKLIFDGLLVSPVLLRLAGNLLYLYHRTGLRELLRGSGLLRELGLAALDPLTPPAERPFFFRQIGKVFPAEGARRYRVAFLAGCIANVSFARLNEATIRVLRKNGCEVAVPSGQTCCGALHVHSGLREQARKLARRNIDAFLGGDCFFDRVIRILRLLTRSVLPRNGTAAVRERTSQSQHYDAIVTNAAGCGSTLKEYGELLADDAAYAERAKRFSALTKDINEFLDSIELNREMGEVRATATYQDSCHLAHGQRVRLAPRRLLEAIPGLVFREMPLADLCCGSAGIYNVVQSGMARAILENKMEAIDGTGAEIVVTANPGCLLQLRAGVELYGHGQRVVHVVELLDEAYRKARPAQGNGLTTGKGRSD